jgi:hypothetical protein
LTAQIDGRYAVLADPGIVELFGARTPEVSVVIAAVDAALADPTLGRGFGFLYDRRHLGPITEDTIRLLVARLSSRGQLAGSRLALVVADREQADVFHLNTGTGGSPLVLRTFHDRDEARLWLSLRPA